MANKPRFESETIVFNGIKFRRYPNSKNLHDRNYYRPAANHFRRGIEHLHREIWKSVHGEIPPDCDIHHIDENPLNNAIENLQCLTKSEHAELHARNMPEWKRQWLRTKIKKIRPLADNWHRSEAGREWHRAAGKHAWEHAEPISLVCEVCGETFQTLAHHGNTRFCSNNCRAQYRRNSGIDNEVRICKNCGTEFTVNQYSIKQFCTRDCFIQHRESNRVITPQFRAELTARSKEFWTNAKPKDYICQFCGEAYQSRSTHGRNKYCSLKCRNAANRQRRKKQLE